MAGANYYVSLNRETGQQKMVIIFDSGSVRTVENNHPRYDDVKEFLDSGEATAEGISAILDAAINDLSERLIQVTDRVSIANGHFLVDGDVTDNALSRHIMKMLDDGDNNYLNVVKFYENLLQNPSEYSREQLFDWLTATNGFSIDENGYVLGYKYVDENGYSYHAGYAYVDGQLVQGKIPYARGSIVTMPRADVESDPTVGCSTGLHIGTWNYVAGRQHILKVAYNPRDVVSVPSKETDKLRVCRLAVLEFMKNPEYHKGTSFKGSRFYVDNDDYYYDDNDDYYYDDNDGYY